MSEIPTKQCTKCNEIKQLSEFYKDKRHKDGLYSHCKTCDNSHSKAYREANKEKNNARDRAYYEANKEANKEAENARIKAYKKANPDKVNAQAAKRRATKLQATPPWLSKEDFKDIRKWYTSAKDLQWLSEEPLEVDHIIPLQGKEVCGLHVPWNLQILTAKENASKGNKLL